MFLVVSFAALKCEKPILPSQRYENNKKADEVQIVINTIDTLSTNNVR